MKVSIHTAAIPDQDVNISDEAAAVVRMSFNPSSLPTVDCLKALAAAFISMCADVSGAPNSSGKPVSRECAIAMTHMETAAMWAVKAATAGK